MNQCRVRIKPFPGVAIMNCELRLLHDGHHQSVIRDYAYPGSETALTWMESDRRNFTGEWVECPEGSCILPANHPRDHAS